MRRYPIAVFADLDEVQRARAAVAASLNSFSPGQGEAILRRGGFSDVRLFAAVFTWRGWVTSA